MRKDTINSDWNIVFGARQRVQQGRIKFPVNAVRF